MEQFEEQPCLHDENEDTAQETGHYKLPEGAVAAHKVDEDFWSAVDSARKRSRHRERMRHAVARLCFMVLFVGIGKRLGEKSCYRGREDKLYASCG